MIAPSPPGVALSSLLRCCVPLVLMAHQRDFLSQSTWGLLSGSCALVAASGQVGVARNSRFRASSYKERVRAAWLADVPGFAFALSLRAPDLGLS